MEHSTENSCSSWFIIMEMWLDNALEGEHKVLWSITCSFFHTMVFLSYSISINRHRTLLSLLPIKIYSFLQNLFELWQYAPHKFYRSLVQNLCWFTSEVLYLDQGLNHLLISVSSIDCYVCLCVCTFLLQVLFFPSRFLIWLSYLFTCITNCSQLHSVTFHLAYFSLRNISVI